MWENNERNHKPRSSAGAFLLVKVMDKPDDYVDDYTVAVDEYIRMELGWQDIVDDLVDDELDDLHVGYSPVNEFCDGPYQKLESGCYRRMPCGGIDDE